MKRLICLALVLLMLLGCLTACDLAENMLGAMVEEAEATPKVEEMMIALADNRTSDAKSLMHPQVEDATDDAIAQMSAYLAGRKASAIEPKTFSFNTSTGTAGTIRREQITYQVTLTDGAVIYLNVNYISNDQGAGFTSFQLVLGVV